MLCTTCGPDLKSIARYSKDLHKMIYMQHTMFLPPEHQWRKNPLYYLDTWDGGDDERPQPNAKSPAYWRRTWDRVCNPTGPLQYDRCGVVFLSLLHKLEYW